MDKSDCRAVLGHCLEECGSVQVRKSAKSCASGLVVQKITFFSGVLQFICVGEPGRTGKSDIVIIPFSVIHFLYFFATINVKVVVAFMSW